MSDPAKPNLTPFEARLSRLLRTRVLRWTLGYVCAAWLVLQGFNLLDANYDWPKPLLRLVPVVLAAGIPAVAFAAWAFGRAGTCRNYGRAGLMLLALLSTAVGATLGLSKGARPKPVEYLTPEGRPVTPVLRSWPQPLLDAMIVGAEGRRGRYAVSGAEHREGLVIEPGDLLVFSVLFRNDAAEQGHGWEIASNVRLVMGVDTTSQTRRVATVGIAGDNIFSVYTGTALTGNSFVLRSEKPVRLVYVPGSTQLCMRKSTRMKRVTATFEDLIGGCDGNESTARFLEDGIVERKATIGLIPALHSVTVVFGLRVVEADERIYVQ